MKPTSCALGLLLLLAASPARAGMCDSDGDPAATLLLPYFEVNLDNPAAGNTLFTINNALAESALAHVTFWTDWAHPTFTFDVFLTGYDIVQVNLADAFLGGSVPLTADLPSDPLDQISPHGGFRNDGGFTSGPRPERDGSFPECEDFFPFYSNPLIEAENYERLIDGHTGQPIPILDYKCLGANHGDEVARGYVTIDRVNRCSTAFPIDRFGPYFAADGTGVASNVNQLWGDWFYVDRDNGFAHGDSLVHIEALDGFDARGDGTADPQRPDPASGYTFYGRYTFAGEDNREPLGTAWAVRYLNNALFAPGGTDFTVWRDPAVGQFEEIGYPCGFPGAEDRGPGWHPLDESLVIAFDEFENNVEICQSSEAFCFPLASQRTASTRLGSTDESAPWGAGWMLLDLRHPEAEGPFGRLSQSHVSVTHSAVGLLSVGLPALELSSACDADGVPQPDV